MPTVSPARSRSVGALPFILLLAATVRLAGMTTRPLWYDEAFAILFAEKGPGAMLYGTLAPSAAGAADIHPLGYYTLLWLWMRAFGSSLVSVRLLSILAGIATVALAYLVAHNLYDKRGAIIASIFVALAPFQVHYSQEIRMYPFLALWLLLTTYAYLRGTKGDGTKWWILFSVAAALAQYTHNLAAFYLIPLAVTPLLGRDGKTLRAVIFAGLGAIILYLPWLLQLPGQFTKISTAYWVEQPGLEKIFTLLLVFVTNLPLPGPLLFVGLFIALAAFAIAALQTFRRANREPGALWLFHLSFSPAILLFIFSQWTPVYIERALLPSGIIFCIWLAWAFFESSLPIPLRNGLIILLAVGAGLGLYQHVTYAGFPYAPYRELDAFLRAESMPGDTIVHSSKLTMLPAVYYDRNLAQTYLADPPGSRVDTLAPSTQQVLGWQAQADIASATEGANRVWFIIFEQSILEYKNSGEAAHPHLAWLSERYALIEILNFGDLRLHLFSKHP